MDEYLRDLERKFNAGQLVNSEKYRLQERYCQVYGQCPEDFVIQRIREELASFVAYLRQHHEDSLEKLEEVFRTMSSQFSDDADGRERLAQWQAYSKQHLEEKRPYLLNISYSVDRLPNLPIILARVSVHLSMATLQNFGHDSLRGDWLRSRSNAVKQIQNILGARLSQCHYFDCVDDSARRNYRHNVETVTITAVGMPRALIDTTGNLQDQVSRISDVRTRQLIEELLASTISHRSDILAIKSLVEINLASLPQDSALRNWMIEPYPEARRLPGVVTSRSFQHGFLILAGVSNDTLLRFAPDRQVADHELTLSFEADVTDLPEMIYFYAPPSPALPRGRLVIVPAGSHYFKACRFLRLIAGL